MAARDDSQIALSAESSTADAQGGARKIFRNAGVLLGGKAFGGLLSLAYLAIAARALGPVEMGYLVVASAYALAVAGVARFQSWQAIIRFGSPMVEAGDRESLRLLLQFTIRLDIASGVLSLVVAFAFIGLASHALKWPPQAMPFIYLYCCAVPFLISATPTGILRLFDRFSLLGWQSIAMPLVRFFGALVAWAMDGGLTVFLVTWILSGILDGVALWTLGFMEMRRRDIVPDIRVRADAAAPRAWLDYMLKSNIASIFEIARNGLPMLIVGAILGSGASGFLQLAVNLTNLIAHPANMLSQATLPELTKTAMIKGRRAMLAVAYRTMAISLATATPFVLMFILFRAPLVTAVGGPAYAPAAAALALMAVAQVPRTSSIVLESASLGVGYAGAALAAQGLAAAAQLASLFYLLPLTGVSAAPVAFMIGSAVMIATHLVKLHDIWRWR